YEYLEQRFDLKTRLLGAFFFLVQRGLAAGITIYAPAIILSSILEWNLTLTILLTGILVIVYTVSGGTRAVSITQKQQMTVIMLGMLIAFGVVIYYISEFISFGEAIDIAGVLNKTKAVDFDFNFEKRYTFWSGITGGLILALSYFGTDQSQVQRYLGARNIAESRMGLMFNAIFKIPMQFFILFTGVMVYIFYIFYTPPIHFKEQSLELIRASPEGVKFQVLEEKFDHVMAERKSATLELAKVLRTDGDPQVTSERLSTINEEAELVRQEVKDLIKRVDPEMETKDSDYVFLTFILDYLPHGLIGLLIAVIFSAAMSSTSSELNSLASTTAVDFYKRLMSRDASDSHFVLVSKGLTFLWGMIAIMFAFLAKNSENLIEAVNIVGSIFYGTMLGIFLVALLLPFVRGTAVFIAAIVTEVVVISLHVMNEIGAIVLGYLWYNAIGCFLTIVLAVLINFFVPRKQEPYMP
ncbi:MAG: sodium:solute symporter, partial [Cyclobacteriaceae bacterium]|nr:sodium:solute symporter [Cyclobacteriaceae bacterium HetDA_MAG_MS6]